MAQADRLADKLLRTYCSPGVKHEYYSERTYPDMDCWCYSLYCHRCGQTIEVDYRCSRHANV